jgi:uncharacterized protein (TIGR02246 family)
MARKAGRKMSKVPLWEVKDNFQNRQRENMQSDEQEIRQLVTTWMEATKSGDTETILSLMSEDVIFLVTGQPPMIGKSAFAAALQSQSKQGRPDIDGKSEIQEIRVLGDWAYMWTKLEVVVTPPGGPPSMKRAGHTLSILKKEAGKWVLARDANLLSPVSI